MNMKTLAKSRKICDSWYHQRWFRILLIIVAIDMILLGSSFAFGIDITTLTDTTHPLLRVIGGLAYILVAIFIIHYATSYEKMKKKNYLVCQHCAMESAPEHDHNKMD